MGRASPADRTLARVGAAHVPFLLGAVVAAAIFSLVQARADAEIVIAPSPLPLQGEVTVPLCRVTWEDFKGGVNAGVLSIMVTELREDQREQFLAAYNATPPAGNIEASAVYVFSSPLLATGLVAFVKDGCMVEYIEAPLPAIMLWMEGKTGLESGRRPRRSGYAL